MKSENHITLEQFAPLVYSFFALASVLSIITSQQKLPLVVMFILDSLIQPFLGLKGMTGGSDYWVVLRCVLKLISFPFYFKYTNSDLSWIFIDIHMLQIGPNFSKSYLTAHIFTVFNIMTHFVLSYCFLQRSFLFTFSLTFSFIYQYTLITCYKKLYTDKTKTLEQKVSEFESVWASIQSNVIKTDLNLNILLINKGFLGKSVEELTGFSFKKLSIFNEQKFDALKKEKKTQIDPLSIFNILPISPYTTLIFVIQDTSISEDLKQLILRSKVKEIVVTKSKMKIEEMFKSSSGNCKLFVDDDLIYQIPTNIPHENVKIFGNSSKKESEYNDCLRLFKPLLASNLIAELTPPLKKKISQDEYLLDGASVMIVEDHVVIQKCLKRFIEKMSPLKIFVASNGAEALRYFKNEIKIDFVITDINMPVMNGFDLVKSIKSMENGKQTKIIVETGELNKMEN
eukprot:gene1404-12024_t